MADHVLKRFDEELTKLRYRLVRIGTLVQHQTELAISSVLEGNTEHAKMVLEIEEKVDRLDIKIDKQCLRIFALHQPVAMDLRLVLSAVSMNDNIELMGDLASNIAKNVLKMDYIPNLIPKTKFYLMSELVNQNIAKVLDAFVNMEIAFAYDSIKIDSELTEIFDENQDLLIKLMKEDASLVNNCGILLDTNRNLQTISRLCRSIAQELVFLVKAKIVKHKSIDEIISQQFDTEYHDSDSADSTDDESAQI